MGVPNHTVHVEVETWGPSASSGPGSKVTIDLHAESSTGYADRGFLVPQGQIDRASAAAVAALRASLGSPAPATRKGKA